MEQSFNHLADAVRLPESSRARIRTQIASHRKEQEASTVKQPKKHLPRLAVAAIIIAAALTLTAAAAAVIHQFRNDILISDLSEIPEPTGDAPTAVAVAEPASDRKDERQPVRRVSDHRRHRVDRRVPRSLDRGLSEKRGIRLTFLPPPGYTVKKPKGGHRMLANGWQTLFKPHILDLGEAYWQQGHVAELHRTPDGIQAVVAGSEDYEVEVELEDGMVCDMYCSCHTGRDRARLCCRTAGKRSCGRPSAVSAADGGRSTMRTQTLFTRR